MMSLNENIVSKLKSLRSKKSFMNADLKTLRGLPTYSGVWELSFQNNQFFMLNLKNDDAIPLKYFWRYGYEHYSLDIWYQITRKDEFYIDIGAHSGIYSIIGNLKKSQNKFISIEPYYINYARLMDNLKLNNLSVNLCFLAAATNYTGTTKFNVKISGYHPNGGKISNDGNIVTSAIKIDDMNISEKIGAMKIDTEGYEYEALQGAEEIIKLYKPHIIIEMNESSFDNAVSFLKKFNYEFFLINDHSKTLSRIESFVNIPNKLEGINCLATTKIEEIQK